MDEHKAYCQAEIQPVKDDPPPSTTTTTTTTTSTSINMLTTCSSTISISSSSSSSNTNSIHNLISKNPSLFSSILTKLHAGYFRITFSFCAQSLLWKTLQNSHNPYLQIPNPPIIVLWSISLLTLLTLSSLYILRCFFHFKLVKAEFLHHVGVNYLFAPWISWLLLLQSSPFVPPKSVYYFLLWWFFCVPLLILDVKIYGQWLTKGKRFLSTVANPTSQISVIANLVGARSAAQMGWKESGVCLFALGITHYLVLFVTLYQRFSGSDRIPAMLRPVFFLFIAAPSMASLAWDSVSGGFGTTSKMFFFLSAFLFACLACRPSLFKKSMKKFSVAWWAYSFPMTVLAMASTEYAKVVRGCVPEVLMFILLGLSVLVFLSLVVSTAFNTSYLLSDDSDPIAVGLSSTPTPGSSSTLAPTLSL